MEFALQQKQQQSLLMSFELRQAIEILQYSTCELDEYIRQQELENPLIELVEAPPNNFDEAGINQKYLGSYQGDMRMDMIQSNASNIRLDLYEQVRILYSDDYTRSLLKYLIDNLDDNGYLCGIEDILLLKTGITISEIEKGIHLLQSIGPIGIGARDVKECLLLQIHYSSNEHQLATYLIEHHFDLLVNKKWREIAKYMNICNEKLKEINDYILTLNPRPCSFQSNQVLDYLNPDITVERKNNTWVFHFNDAYLPSISLNKDYVHYLNEKNDTATYLKKHYKNYEWLIHSIEQRKNTITKVMTVLLEKQQGFFNNGFTSLKPLTLKEVANSIGMHESTVSRVTMNKVIQTPFGSIEFQQLFTSKLETVDGNSISIVKVKSILETIISQENKKKPLSDQKIAEYFSLEMGVLISRRTISKYRDELSILSSSKRREI
jgi:RNA polymerase sigma-54 factor